MSHNKRMFDDWTARSAYHDIYTKNNGKASDCIKCGRCENTCTQHLFIRDLLKEVVDEFEK